MYGDTSDEDPFVAKARKLIYNPPIMDAAPQPPEKRRIAALLLLIVLTGTLFRVAGLSSGYQRVDDIPVARQIMQNYLGDWRPDYVYYYPNFFDYIVAVVLRGVSAAFRLVGVQRGPGLFPFSLDQVLFAARLLSALLGSATILVVYAIGRRLHSEREGRLAAFLFSVAFIHILFSHQIVLDVPMTFFYGLSLYFCVLISQRGRWSDYALAGFVGGLAVATKYNGIFIFAAVFLSHLWARETAKKRILKGLLNPKIFLAGGAGAAGFFCGHPYSLLNIKGFLGASRLLLRSVHETEWFLRPIQPKTWLEHLAYNKQVLALKNILTGEGPVFLALILIGVVAVCLRRNRRTAWLPLAGLAYFVGAISYLGFSRHRDLPTFAIFYAFLAMSGIRLIQRWGLRSGAARRVSGLLVAAAVITLEYGAWAKSYYLWEDDTTEIAERWIRRNIPATDSIGKEWFTPPLVEREPRYRTFARPYLFSSGFTPFSRFDYLILSSAAYGHFFRHEKFYPDYLLFYRSFRAANERVKDFFFWDIEYKNPELNIFHIGRPGRKRQGLTLPLSVPWDSPAREFECLDGSPYGKSSLSFYLEGGQRIKRWIISRAKVPSLAVMVSGAENAGRVEIAHAGMAIRVEVKPGETSMVILNPRRTFPFYRYLYGISVKDAGLAGPVLVRLAADEFEIGSELFRLGRWREARTHLLRALKDAPPPASALEIAADLAVCCRELGLAEEAKRFAALAKDNPVLPKYLELLGPAEDEGAWRRSFEKFSGLDLGLFEVLQTNRIPASEMRRETPADRGAAGNPGDEEVRLVSAEKNLPPQRYHLRLRFTNPSGVSGPIGELEVVSGGPGPDSRQVFPIELDGTLQAVSSQVTFSADIRERGGRVRFILTLDKEARASFQELAVFPDVHDFLLKNTLPVLGLADEQGGGGR